MRSKHIKFQASAQGYLECFIVTNPAYFKQLDLDSPQSAASSHDFIIQLIIQHEKKFTNSEIKHI